MKKDKSNASFQELLADLLTICQLVMKLPSSPTFGGAATAAECILRDMIFAPAFALGQVSLFAVLEPNRAASDAYMVRTCRKAIGIWNSILEFVFAHGRLPTRLECQASATECSDADWREYHVWSLLTLPVRDRIGPATPPDIREIVISATLEAFANKWLRPLVATDRIRILSPKKGRPGRQAWEKLAARQLTGNPDLAWDWFSAMRRERGSPVADDDLSELILVDLLADMLNECDEPADRHRKRSRSGWFFKRKDGLITWNYAKAIGSAIDDFRENRRTGVEPEDPPDPASLPGTLAAAAHLIEVSRAVQAWREGDPNREAAWACRCAQHQVSCAQVARERGLNVRAVQRAFADLERLLRDQASDSI